MFFIFKGKKKRGKIMYFAWEEKGHKKEGNGGHNATFLVIMTLGVTHSLCKNPTSRWHHERAANETPNRDVNLVMFCFI